MNYQLRDRRKKDNVILKLIAAFIFVFLVHWTIGTWIAETLYSVQYGVARFFGYYEDPVRPISENALIKDLKRENASLKQILGRTDEPEIDISTDPNATSTEGTASTTTALRIKEAKKYNTPDSNTVLGVVLVRPPRTPYDSLLIDIGEDEGLLSGDVVYAENNYVIGTIVEVYKATSVVKLYSSPDQKIDVLLGSSTIPVVAEGRGSGNFYIKLPKNIEVNEGDQIVMPGIRSKVVGTAERVDSDEGEAYSHVYFRMPVHLYSLHYVQVKKNVR